MRKDGHLTGFYLETLLMITVFIGIILILTQVFVLGKVQSGRASRLTGAVTLAENAAEAVSASHNVEELAALLNENGNASPMTDTAGVTAFYDTDMNPDPAGPLRLDVTWLPKHTERGVLVSSVILVRDGPADEPVYRLDTAVFLPEVKP